MKILLYTENLKAIGKSGLGKAISHQKSALSYKNIDYTTDIHDEYDILHINTYFLKSYFFAKKAKKNGKKIVYHAHSTEEDYKDGFVFGNITSKLFKKWIIKCYSLGDVIVTPTIYSKKILEGYPGLDNKKIYAISNGIDLDFFKPKKNDRKIFMNKYGYNGNDKIIVGIGLYIRRKGIVDFVELARRLPEYKFIWFGSSPLVASTQDVRDAVSTKLDNLFFAGYVEREGIREALSACDLYLFPTFEETEGIPIIEACALKCDSIVRDIPIFDDFLFDGINCYKAKDVDEFEHKIKLLLEGDLPSVASNGYRIASERDIKKMGEELSRVYEEVNNM
ncbi:MAG: glycosyltransferase family 4 protein [Bacilli bacterium]|nr:glycosyltransferase family 4 protein [Bacilli bacterium]